MESLFVFVFEKFLSLKSFILILADTGWHNSVMKLHWLNLSPFRTLPWQKMTAQFQFFQSLPHKKANFVKKSRPNMG